jgi:HD-GYP domain-containing protein (c-di-GMP phosphodiesterase class II)
VGQGGRMQPQSEVSVEEATKTIVGERESHLDPDAVDVLLESFDVVVSLRGRA